MNKYLLTYNIIGGFMNNFWYGRGKWVIFLIITGLLIFYQLILTFFIITRFNIFILFLLFLFIGFCIFKVIW